MSRIKIIKLIVLTLTILSLGCEKDEKNTGFTAFSDPYHIEPQDVICPLAVGNTWTYVDTTIENGYLSIDTIRYGIEGTISTMVNNKYVTAYLFSSFNNSTGQYSDYKMLLNNESDGLWDYGDMNNNDTAIEPYLWAKYPVNIGDYWLAYEDGYYEKIIYCTSKNTIIKCGNKSYNCIEYKHEYSFKSKNPILPLPFHFIKNLPIPENNSKSEYVLYQYFAPSIGLVASRFYYQGTIFSSITLLGYNINK